MVERNKSMEEDTELRDLVVQTLENNGVLAKVRAELRASVFLALEEQESVMNPEPLLNKTVKQYLANSEGKLLFSLVREFLEYFGLDYTISVYDPETYFGKEYNYVGRTKLCEELGINSSEPLLGEILKNSMIGAFNNTQKNETINSKENQTCETSTNFANTTFEVPVSKILHNDSASFSNDNDSSEKLENMCEQSAKIPINVTITDRKNKEPLKNTATDFNNQQNSLREDLKITENTVEENDTDSKGNNNIHFEKHSNDTNAIINHKSHETEIITSNETSLLNTVDSVVKSDESILTEVQSKQNEDIAKQNSKNNMEIQVTNNVQNKKPASTANSFGKTLYFEEIIVDGKMENVSSMHKTECFLDDLSDKKTNSIFSDLPPLNGKKTNINDLKEIMDLGLATDGIDNYEEDFVSSASGSANEQSPSNDPNKIDNSLKLQIKKEDKIQSARSDDISEEIEEIDEILSSTSCLEDMNMDKNLSNFTTGITANYIEEM